MAATSPSDRSHPTLHNKSAILYQVFSHAEYVPDRWRDGEMDQREDLRNSSWYGGLNLAGLRKWILKRSQSTGFNAAIQIVPSLSGGHIAILHYQKVTILSREDHFRKALGVFTEFSEAEQYVLGVWVDDFDIVVVVSNLNVVYLLNSRAELFSRLSLNGQNLKGTIIGTFATCALEENAGDYKYELLLITSEATLHRIRINHKRLMFSDYNNKVDARHDLRRYHPFGVLSTCFHKEQSILVIFGPLKANRRQKFSGEFCFSIWKAKSFSSLHLLCCSSSPGGYSKISWSLPFQFSANSFQLKVVISPDTNLLAFLDFQGKLHLMRLRNDTNWVLEDLPLSNIMHLSTTQRIKQANTQCFQESDFLLDIEWWSRDALICASLTKIVDIVHVPGLFGLLEPVPMFSSSSLHVTKNVCGRFFVLEELEEEQPREFYSTNLDSERNTSSVSNRITGRIPTSHSLNGESGWRLISLMQRSAPELLRILIENGEYESALSLTRQYDLDADEVYKCRWRSSDFGIHAIEQNLPAVKDRKWVVTECLESLCSNAEAMNALLLYGLAETEPYSNDENEHTVGTLLHVENLWWFRFKRLRLLQYQDRLATFVGMHMGRYFPAEFSQFRTADLQKIAVSFAEGGKTGALDLLFKRHLLSLAPAILIVLDAIPETLPPHSYSYLLPEAHPPKAYIPRQDGDWIENDHTLQAIMDGLPGMQEQKLEVHLSECTEHMVKLYKGLIWPKEVEITNWYRKRAIEIDRLSGQLENSLILLDLGLSKGFKELQIIWENVTDLYKVSFASIDTESVDVECSFSDWEKLSSYNKFKMTLNGVHEANVVDRLRDVAIPFLHKNNLSSSSVFEGSRNEPFSGIVGTSNSFVVKWLEELAIENKLGICAAVLEEACKTEGRSWLFRNEVEIIEASVDCIYLCTETNQWSLMARILSRLPGRHRRESPSFSVHEDTNQESGFRKGFAKAFRRPSNHKTISMSSLAASQAVEEHLDMGALSPKSDSQGAMVPEMIDKRVKQTEGHVEAGKLLYFYQVPRPIQFFLSSQQEASNTKQLLRLLISRFSRKQPARSESDWANLWRDLRILQEKAFTFLDKEYLLLELCRGLLKAEKFSVARNYLKGTGSVVLTTDKVEKLVIQAARDYFYSASSIDSPDIEKAKECLSLSPPSKLLTEEANLIEAITVLLPDLGVTLLPLQFRQVSDSMEVVKMAISAQSSSFFRVEEIKEVARLLGFTSQDDLAVVEAAIAREAAAAGYFEIATDLCLGLLKKAYGPIWDLCAAIGRGPSSEHLDLKSRKDLLGFALEHCDEESVGELLTAWKEFDLISQCNELGSMVSEPIASLEDHESFMGTISISEAVTRLENFKTDENLSNCEQKKDMWQAAKDSFFTVTGQSSKSNEQILGISSRQTKNFLGFVCLQLPWLVELVSKGKEKRSCTDNQQESKASCIFFRDSNLTRECSIPAGQATAIILYGCSSHGIIPSDDLVLLLVKKLLEKPTSYNDNVLGCGYILNLVDAGIGARMFEQALKERKDFHEAKQGIKVAIVYSQLHEIGFEMRPERRRQFLYNILRGQKFPVPAYSEKGPQTQVDFWTTWRSAFENKLQLMEQTRILEQMIPGVEIGKFISGDQDYIKEMVFLLVESVEPNQLIKTLALAEAYRVDKWQVLLHSFTSQTKHTLLFLKEKYEICRDYFQDLSPSDFEMFLHIFFQASTSSSIAASNYIEDGDYKLSVISSLLTIWIQALTDVQNYLDQGQNTSDQERSCMFIQRNVHETAICCMAYQRLLPENLVTLKQGWTVLIKIAEEEFFLQAASAAHTIFKVMASIGCSLESLLAMVNFFSENGAIVVALSEGSANTTNASIGNAYEFNDSINLRLSLIPKDPGSSNEEETTSNNSRLRYIQCVYKDVVNGVLEIMTTLSDDVHVNMKPLMSVLTSLSANSCKYNGEFANLNPDEKHSYFEILQTVREGVWKQLSEFSDESKVPPEVRVIVLELLDITMTGNLKSIHSFDSSLVDRPIFWDGWGGTFKKHKRIMQTSGQDQVDVYKSRSSLTAIKSNGIISMYWPGKEVKAEQFADVNELVSFFETLVTSTSSSAHAVALFSILKEWDRIVVSDQISRGVKLQAADEAEDSWGSGEGWGEGWEDVEGTTDKNVRKDNSNIILHKLHRCWNMAFHKVVHLGYLREAMEALDSTLSTCYVVLTEDESKDLVARVGDEDPVSALKIALLLPYATTQDLGLDLVKKHLDHQKSRKECSNFDASLLVLVLASRRLPSLAGDAELIKIFAGLCEILGSLARCLEQDYEARLAAGRLAESSTSFREDNSLAIIALPFFVAELTQFKHYGLAGEMVLQFMRVHPVLATWNTLHIALKKYLDVQIQLEDERSKSTATISLVYTDSFGLPQTRQRLGNLLPKILNSALSILSNDMD